MKKTNKNGFAKVNLKEVIEFFDKALHNMEDVARALALAWNSGFNVYLYGRGGYGKSMAVEVFRDFLVQKEIIKKEDFSSKAFHSETSADDVFGGVDMIAYKEGRIQYNLDESVLMRTLAVAEEMGDTSNGTMMAFKDALQAGFVRNGNQQVKIGLNTLVACANWSPEDLIGNSDSMSAFMARFFYKVKTEWSSHRPDDYRKAIKKSLTYFGRTDVLEDKSFDMWMILTELTVAELNNVYIDQGEGKKVSPRDAFNFFMALMDNQTEEVLKSFGVGELAPAHRINISGTWKHRIQQLENPNKAKTDFSNLLGKLSKAIDTCQEAAKNDDYATMFHYMLDARVAAADFTQNPSYGEIKSRKREEEVKRMLSYMSSSVSRAESVLMTSSNALKADPAGNVREEDKKRAEKFLSKRSHTSSWTDRKFMEDCKNILSELPAVEAPEVSRTKQYYEKL